ncbi:MAG: hypothetical protein AB4058_20735 [Microcystaceae cyanobacterium]
MDKSILCLSLSLELAVFGLNGAAFAQQTTTPTSPNGNTQTTNPILNR